MKIIVEDQKELVEVARLLTIAADSILVDCRKSPIEQTSLSDQLLVLRDTIAVNNDMSK